MLLTLPYLKVGDPLHKVWLGLSAYLVYHGTEALFIPYQGSAVP